VPDGLHLGSEVLTNEQRSAMVKRMLLKLVDSLELTLGVIACFALSTALLWAVCKLGLFDINLVANWERDLW
jgi:hypothetical protein